MTEPSGLYQFGHLDFSQSETTTGWNWRLAGRGDYRSKYELPLHISPTGNQHDAIELALANYQAMLGHLLTEAYRSIPRLVSRFRW